MELLTKPCATLGCCDCSLTLQNTTVLSRLNMLNITLATKEGMQMHFLPFHEKATVYSALSHCDCITHYAMCLLQKACNLKTSKARCQSVRDEADLWRFTVSVETKDSIISCKLHQCCRCRLSSTGSLWVHQ